MLDNIMKLKKPELKFSVHNPQAIYDIAANVRQLVADARAGNQEIVILCIGTDRSTGDSLGPLTGSKLHSLSFSSNVYGTLDDPVHATNLAAKLQHIGASYHQPYIIAIDACLGRLESVGCVSLGRGPVKPGAAVNKDLPAVGDAYITGIVNVGGFMEHLVLQSTRLNLVMKMADTIAAGLSFALKAPR
ncbi:spore protease YyaC|uniref:Putative sporulation protein YyaC n=1 Tax=Dendrosporobacter quercicolus TaxID=146817 RepID=A0A1G9XYU4_9FIRM|nr:spore protease YyaC [Dendrosporobacter quercicolus]NSL49055.1 spore protease YyaC [Dendrosporobacter quercicolus DSM 1736]SDN01345.1 putative sporulation protein YyaC [Dendrosporobacter quercicolus]